MYPHSPDRLLAALYRLRAAEAERAGATQRLLEQRRRALYGNPDAAALHAARDAYLRADAEAVRALHDYERLTGTVSPVTILEAAAVILGRPTAPPTRSEPPASEPPAWEREPEPYVPLERDVRRWEFTRWLIAQGKLTEHPAQASQAQEARVA